MYLMEQIIAAISNITSGCCGAADSSRSSLPKSKLRVIRLTMGLFRLVVFSVMLCIFCTAQASDDELYDNLIHSDVPLWSASDDNVWPQNFTNEDEFGCVNRSKFGDWRFTDSDGDHMWYRFQNYGVFHCWVNVYEAYERDELETAEHKPSFFVELTNVDRKKVNYDLWAIQIGARPGSDYSFACTRI